MKYFSDPSYKLLIFCNFEKEVSESNDLCGYF